MEVDWRNYPQFDWATMEEIASNLPKAEGDLKSVMVQRCADIEKWLVYFRTHSLLIPSADLGGPFRVLLLKYWFWFYRIAYSYQEGGPKGYDRIELGLPSWPRISDVPEGRGEKGAKDWSFVSWVEPRGDSLMPQIGMAWDTVCSASTRKERRWARRSLNVLVGECFVYGKLWRLYHI